jgi:hypothetical protein
LHKLIVKFFIARGIPGSALSHSPVVPITFTDAIEILGLDGLPGGSADSWRGAGFASSALTPRRDGGYQRKFSHQHRPICDPGARLLTDNLDARTDHRRGRAAQCGASI